MSRVPLVAGRSSCYKRERLVLLNQSDKMAEHQSRHFNTQRQSPKRGLLDRCWLVVRYLPLFPPVVKRLLAPNKIVTALSFLWLVTSENSNPCGSAQCVRVENGTYDVIFTQNCTAHALSACCIDTVYDMVCTHNLYCDCTLCWVICSC